jgi:hypothetical protein
MSMRSDNEAISFFCVWAVDIPVIVWCIRRLTPSCIGSTRGFIPLATLYPKLLGLRGIGIVVAFLHQQNFRLFLIHYFWLNAKFFRNLTDRKLLALKSKRFLDSMVVGLSTILIFVICPPLLAEIQTLCFIAQT